MTRFARAKGSKASNERVAEDATSWAEMKHQLNSKKEEVETQKMQKVADAKRKKNYDNFIKEVEKDEAKSNEWADFPETITSLRKKQQQKVVQEAAGKSDLELNTDMSKNIAKSNEATDENCNVDVNGLIVANVVKKKKAKKRKLGTEEKGEMSNTDPKKVKSTPNGSQTGKTKKKKKKPDVAPKKTVDEMTEEERKKYEKNKDKKVKQLEKRKLKKQKIKEQKEAQKNGTATAESGAKQMNNPKLNTKTPPKVKKFDPNKEHKRRKPIEEVQKVVINGKHIELVHFDGFPIKREDAERLKELRKQMISKGLPRSEVKIAMKLERRRAEKSLSRDKKNVCYNCRQAGHVLSECPAIAADGNTDTAASGICFKCGSTEHTQLACKVVKNQEFRFASCFICKEQGHISWQCPDNARGLYPKGGGCKVCGDVTHLKKDCPKHVAEQEAHAVSLPTLAEDNPDSLESHVARPAAATPRANKIVKF